MRGPICEWAVNPIHIHLLRGLICHVRAPMGDRDGISKMGDRDGRAAVAALPDKCKRHQLLKHDEIRELQLA